jgi:cell shape-determining protein MreC
MSLTNDPFMDGCEDGELRELKEENKKLKEALEYYANPENYKAYYQKNAPVMIEKGERARIALLSVNS